MEKEKNMNQERYDEMGHKISKLTEQTRVLQDSIDTLRKEKREFEEMVIEKGKKVQEFKQQWER